MPLNLIFKPKQENNVQEDGSKKARTIRSINRNQHSIIRDIIELHNEGKPIECDITYSIGNFYGTFEDENGTFTIDQPKYKFDVYPQIEGVEKMEINGPIPLPDNSINSICIDLPFVISVGPSMEGPDYDEDGKRVKNNMISRRFSCYYPVCNLLKSYKMWIEEAYRVLKPGGICIFKNQDTTTGGKELRTTCWSWLCASSVGFEVLDRFHLIAPARLISGKIKKQQHARKFSSEFWVFKKDDRKNIRYFDHMTDEEIEGMFDGLKEHWIGKKRKNNG